MFALTTILLLLHLINGSVTGSEIPKWLTLVVLGGQAMMESQI
jgi:hypothetical protein